MEGFFKDIFERSDCLTCEWFLTLNGGWGEDYIFHVCKRRIKILTKPLNENCYLYKKKSPDK